MIAPINIMVSLLSVVLLVKLIFFIPDYPHGLGTAYVKNLLNASNNFINKQRAM